MKIAQAGLEWSRMTFILVSVALGAVFGLGVYVMNGSPLIAGAGALVGGFGLPSWLLAFRRKRRLASFVNEFPNAVDIVIRGVKAGLPLGDCLRIIATESPDPLKSEFRRVVEAQAVGLTVTEAVERMAERVPVTESHFFAIVIGIQQKSGGNLTEALGNLSRVIRDRKKMRSKSQGGVIRSQSLGRYHRGAPLRGRRLGLRHVRPTTCRCFSRTIRVVSSCWAARVGWGSASS